MWGPGLSFLNIIFGFVLTLVIEIIIALLFRFRKSNEIKTIALASIITYPVLHFFIGMGYLVGGSFSSLSVFVIFLESIVVVAEFFILFYVFKSKYSWKYLFLIAFTMNAASYGFGLLIF